MSLPCGICGRDVYNTPSVWCACHKPDELTVEDVLGVLGGWMEENQRALDLPGTRAWVCEYSDDLGNGPWALFDAGHFVADGDSPRAVLTEAKRRGLLG